MPQINRVAVLGAGVMGATIAAHLANAGLDVLLLDIVPKEPTDEEKQKGLTVNDPAVRNRLAEQGLRHAISAKPAAFFRQEYAAHIATGNFTDDIAKIKECDWVIEVVVENMDIKRKVLSELVAPNLREDAILSSNTSGLSINGMAEALPDDIKKRFLVTHFFNPPRYMRLMEIVPNKGTDPAVVEAMAAFIKQRLGKGIVYAKDTPNFVGNRIGVYSMLNAIKHMQETGLTVEEVDAVAGPATARPKSAAFRTADLVGVDTLAHVARNTREALGDEDDERDMFAVPDIVEKLVADGALGDKVAKGFYLKEKDEKGQSKISYYDYKDGGYKPLEKPKFGSIAQVKMMDDPVAKVEAMFKAKDKAADFAWLNLRDTLIYAVKRIPEIADDIVNVDNAMKWGFNWEIGPFEMFDAVGVQNFVQRAQEDGVAVPEALQKVEAFYKHEDGKEYYWDIVKGEYREREYPHDFINLQIIKKSGGEVERNANSSVVDIGDGVFLFEFHSKMNSIGGDMLAMTHKAVKRAEDEGVALVIGNRGKLFSAGANLPLLLTAAAEGAWEDINMVIHQFQKATMAVKYSKVPVVAAPFQLALGGGCEFPLHADAIVAHAETYMGLVEVGVGLLPAGGGTKEMALRAVQEAQQFDTDVSPFIFKYFKQIGLGKVSYSGAMLYDMGYLRQGDSIAMDIDRQLYDAKMKALSLARNYRPAAPAVNIPAPGRSVAASMKSMVWNMMQGGFASEHDYKISSLVADVITGGDVPAGTPITEEYLLELERQNFLKLCGERKTIERIQHMLKKGKPLRN